MRNVRRFAAFSVLAGLALAGCTKVDPAPAVPAPPPAAAPELTPIAPEHVREVLASRRGKVVLVNVWATWCLPCREEFPDLMRVYRELQPRGLELVLISADFEAQRDRARAFLAEQGVDFPTYVKTGTDEAFIEAVDPGWSGSIPATLILDRNGVKRAFWDGAAAYERFKAAVEEVL
ncbi:MAG TPA: TlpA disulfide reductase family protein [Thermoanaerobaculaceae bacterium]|nr:TlpA disulfide reductase family protein [Thermoanaerobaculaceae bacterium]HRS15343.1 TlpA disulfide reductase family protein [Thermoanaerobaculaceae bacterium]